MPDEVKKEVELCVENWLKDLRVMMAQNDINRGKMPIRYYHTQRNIMYHVKSSLKRLHTQMSALYFELKDME